ncbi:hypothetical protein AVL50_27575 [Flammeovirga sp. SJP92]|nr:hypothetical protein AVL50_27575 [Flammeovirga sp. SJP92]
MLCTGVFAQSTSIASSESYQNFRTKAKNSIFDMMERSTDSTVHTLGDISCDIFSKNNGMNESKIKIIISEMQHLLDTEYGHDFKNIQYHGAQKSTCDGIETVEIIKSNSFKIENFVSSYLKRYFK